MAELHQAQKLYPGKATYDFHVGNSPTGFQADGFQVIVNTHVIAECEDSECADFICKAWNEYTKTVLAHEMALETLAGALVNARKLEQMAQKWTLDEQIIWLRQSIEAGHDDQAASEARDIVRYCRAILSA